MEKADGDGFGVELRERPHLEGLEHAFGTHPLANADAALERHERLRMIGAQPVEVGACLATQVQHVLEPSRRNERRTRPLSFEKRVRRHGRSVREPFDALRADGARGCDDRFFLNVPPTSTPRAATARASP
jgi:hypothetical protein